MQISKYLPILFLLSFSLFSNQEQNLTFKYVEWGPPGAKSIDISAWKNQKLVGSILLEGSTGKLSKKANIAVISVKPEFRNQGIGNALMNEARKVFEKERYEKIRLMAFPFGNAPKIPDSALIDFYQRHGFKREKKREHLQVGTHMIQVTPYDRARYFKNLKRYFPVTMNPFN